MAGKRIEFTISAVDKATKTVDGINRSIARMTRPYEMLARSTKRFANASGLTKVSKDLGKIASEAEKAARSVTKIAAPLLAIVGGGTLAGLAEMVTQWERIGAETERTSRMLGITAQQLTQMRSAANLMGVSSETMTAGFQALQDTLQDARWGRNQGAFATLQALGISLHSTKTGAIDTQSAMYDLADRMQRIQKRDPAAARNLARSLGVEQLLPVLVKGREGMQAYEAEARRLRGDFTPDMAIRAEGFTQSLARMGQATDGLKASIADRLAPVIGPMIDRITQWTAKNRELISQEIGALVERIANSFEKLVEGVNWDVFLKDLGDAVDTFTRLVAWVIKATQSIGGFKTVAVAVAVYMAGGFVVSLATTIASIVLMTRKLGTLADGFTGVGRAARDAGSTLSRGARARGGLRAGYKAGGVAAGIAGVWELGGILYSDESNAQKERDASSAIGGTVGGVAGSALGGALGSIVPGVGTAIGATLGGIAREWIGRKIGTAAGEALFSDAQRKGVAPQGAGAAGGPGAAAVGNQAAGTSRSVQEWASKLGFGFLEKRYNLPSGLLAAVAQIESKGNAGAISPAGAKGLFQFMPSTEREYGINALDPAQAAPAAALKLSGLLTHYRGNLAAALSAYNWGEGNVDRKGLGRAPAETLAYAPKVMAAMGAGNAPLPPLNAPPPQLAGTEPPVVHVNTRVHVERDGRTSVRTETPNGLHVAYPMAG